MGYLSSCTGQRLITLSPQLAAPGQQLANLGFAWEGVGEGKLCPWNPCLGDAWDMAPRLSCCQALGPSHPDSTCHLRNAQKQFLSP